MRRVGRLAASSLLTAARLVVALSAVVVVFSTISPLSFRMAHPAPGLWRAQLRGTGGFEIAEALAPTVRVPTTVPATASGSRVPTPAASVPTTTTSTTPAPPSVAPPQSSATPPAVPTTTVPVPPAAPGEDQGFGCQAAMSYLSAHAAPGFVSYCPHYADGHQATTTCVGPPNCQPGTEFIYIADPCPAAYMNEASNSWVLIGKSDAPWDPYGYCGQSGNPYGH
ncbi:MAG: hypothetical protein ACYDD4_02925 [Acidimicrobiales bacterium]